MNDSQLIVELGARSHPVFFRSGALAELAERLEGKAPGGRLALVSDTNVAPLHGAPLRAALEDRGLRVVSATVPAGEASKSLPVVAGLYEELVGQGIDRDTPVVALGGGVVGDIAGFVAATLLRGLPWVQVPTTVIAQVDSAVGGKTGVNLAAGKNLVGAFHQPAFVFCDAASLATLPRREALSGLAEVAKHGALDDVGLLDLLVERSAALRAGEVEAYAELLPRAVAVKARIVAADEREAGRRKWLNLGHTLGHALESAAGYGVFAHGEAVALGLRFAAHLSTARGLLPAPERDRLDAVLDACGLPGEWRSKITPAVLDRLASDKKMRGDGLDLILLQGLGRPVVVRTALVDLRREALALAALQRGG